VRLLLGLIVGACIGASPCLAQNAPALTTPAPGPYEAKLDTILASHDSDALLRATIIDVKDTTTALRAMNWLRDRETATGGSVQIAWLYAATLWRFAAAIPEPSKRQLQQSAMAQLFLARMLIATEGFQCADASAPGARRSVVDGQLREIVAYVSAQSDADKKMAASNALAMTLLGFVLRENDIWLCNGGSGFFVKYFERHPNERGKETAAPGGIGKTMVLPPDLSIVPDFVPYDTWKDKRHAALDQISTANGGKKLTNYGDAKHRMK
jgi:hypothetical protein